MSGKLTKSLYLAFITLAYFELSDTAKCVAKMKAEDLFSEECNQILSCFDLQNIKTSLNE